MIYTYIDEYSLLVGRIGYSIMCLINHSQNMISKLESEILIDQTIDLLGVYCMLWLTHLTDHQNWDCAVSNCKYMCVGVYLLRLQVLIVHVLNV